MMQTRLAIYFSTVFSVCTFIESVGLAKPSKDKPAQYEFKVSLINSRFIAEERQDSIQAFVDYINKMPNVKIRSKFKQKDRTVSYIDTDDCDLLNNNYILRKRFDLLNDLPRNLVVTLKYRDVDPLVVGKKIYRAQFSDRLVKNKYESDILIMPSLESRENYSYSASIGLGKEKTLADLQALYPVLGSIDSAKSKKLKNVNGFTALEHAIELGTIKLRKNKCKAFLNFWYDAYDRNKLLLSEFSFRCGMIDGDVQAFHATIASSQDWANQSPILKTEFAYGQFCAN